MRLLVAEPISQEGLNKLQAELDVDTIYGLSRQELLEVIGRYAGFIVRGHIRVDDELLIKGKRLKVVGRAGTGVDNIDIDAATRRGILVVNTPESNAVSAAEHTMALLLGQMRNLPLATALVREGKWEKARIRGVEVLGKTLGVVGLGRIGSLVSQMAQGMGMKVVAYDPYIPLERFERFGAERMATLEELLRCSDFITVHTPKNEETYGMIGVREFELMKGGVRVVNCARGGIIDEEALYQAIRSGKVKSAALDVFDQEPCRESPLFELDSVAFTPHLGAMTVEAQRKVGEAIAEEMVKAMKGELVRHAVNLPAVRPKTLPYLSPFISLAERMGSLYTQLFRPQMGEIEILYRGEIADYDLQLLTTGFLKGILNPILEVKVNLVNASLVAEERGLRVRESRFRQGTGEPSLLTLRGREGELSGTVYGKDDLRITDIDGFRVDFVPSGYILIDYHKLPHTTTPGVIGQIGTLLGQMGVNIKKIQVEGDPQRETALMVLNIDSPLPPEAKEKLLKVEGLLEVRPVKL